MEEGEKPEWHVWGLCVPLCCAHCCWVSSNLSMVQLFFVSVEGPGQNLGFLSFKAWETFDLLYIFLNLKKPCKQQQKTQQNTGLIENETAQSGVWLWCSSSYNSFLVSIYSGYYHICFFHFPTFILFVPKAQWCGLGLGSFSFPQALVLALKTLTNTHMPTLNIPSSWCYNTDMRCKHKLF